MSESLKLHGLQHARLSCPSPTPGACSISCPPSQRCHPTILSSVISFSSCLESFPASGSIPVRKEHWRRKWQPTPVFLPAESHGQRRLVGYSWKEESDMTEQLNHYHHRMISDSYLQLCLSHLPLAPPEIFLHHLAPVSFCKFPPLT